MQRLDEKTLASLSLPPRIEVPLYQRSKLSSGIVHIGVGAFHRAHQALYTHKCLQQDPGHWLITGANLHSRSAFDQLMPQNCLYTVHSVENEISETSVVGSIREVFEPSDREGLLAAMVAVETKIVSLTVTEKGYYLAGENLDLNHPDIVHDLKNPEAPVTVIGLLALALKRRFAAGIPPFTVMSCDNLMNNGPTLKRLVLAYTDLLDSALTELISNHVSFPASMVDRIVPAVLPAHVAASARVIGVVDEACVFTEPFSQWVVQDDFCNDRPAWENVGVLFSDQVAQFEQMKLQLLNAAHSTIAYLGCLAGYETVADCMADKAFKQYISSLMKAEILPTIEARFSGGTQGFDLRQYVDDLLRRFGNGDLHHRCHQIAMDGSKKLPQRMFATLDYCLAHDLPIRKLALSIAAWITFIAGEDLSGNPLVVNDPLADELKRLAHEHGNNPELRVRNIIDHSGVFDSGLRQSERLKHEVIGVLHVLLEDGLTSAMSYAFSSGSDTLVGEP